jgi:quinol-cytochrome oxidoreductase complex cytochrome b subunit
VNVLHLDERVAGWFGTLSTTVVGAAVLAGWFLFLYVVPREYERSVEAFREDRRRRGGGDAP